MVFGQIQTDAKISLVSKCVGFVDKFKILLILVSYFNHILFSRIFLALTLAWGSAPPIAKWSTSDGESNKIYRLSSLFTKSIVGYTRESFCFNHILQSSARESNIWSFYHFSSVVFLHAHILAYISFFFHIDIRIDYILYLPVVPLR